MPAEPPHYLPSSKETHTFRPWGNATHTAEHNCSFSPIRGRTHCIQSYLWHECLAFEAIILLYMRAEVALLVTLARHKFSRLMQLASVSVSHNIFVISQLFNDQTRPLPKQGVKLEPKDFIVQNDQNLLAWWCGSLMACMKVVSG